MNNKKILVLQFRTDESIEHERNCFSKAGAWKNDSLEFVNILEDGTKCPKPSDLNNYSALITAASGQFNVTDWSDEIKEKIEPVVKIFREAIKKDYPTLAVCFGHQLIAQLFGGKVISKDKQSEAGTYQIILTATGRKSKLFAKIPTSFYAVLGHKDSVVKLPRGARRLAYSQRCKIQAYKIKNNIYSIQFHPELDLDDLIWRLKLYPEYLKGKSLKDIKAEYHEITHATKILENFKHLVDEYWEKRV